MIPISLARLTILLIFGANVLEKWNKTASSIGSNSLRVNSMSNSIVSSDYFY